MIVFTWVQTPFGRRSDRPHLMVGLEHDFFQMPIVGEHAGNRTATITMTTRTRTVKEFLHKWSKFSNKPSHAWYTHTLTCLCTPKQMGQIWRWKPDPIRPIDLADCFVVLVVKRLSILLPLFLVPGDFQTLYRKFWLLWKMTSVSWVSVSMSASLKSES